MKIHSRERVAASVVMMLLTLCIVRVVDASAQGKTGKGARARTSAGTSQAPPVADDGRASRHVEEGLRLADEGKWAEALKSYAQAIGVNPRHAEAHLYMGDAYMGLGKSREAFAAYREAIRLDPRNAEAHYSLGAAYNDLAQYGDAFKPLVQAIRLDSGHAEAHYGIGYAYLRLENFKEALGYLKQAVRLRHDYPEAHLSLGLTYLGLDQRKSAEEQLKVLEAMDGVLARVLAKEMGGVAVAAAAPPAPAPAAAAPARSAEQPKPDEGLSYVGSEPAPTYERQVRKPEPTVETTPPQRASPTPRGKPRKAAGDSAATPQQPAQSAAVKTQPRGAASLTAVEVSFWDSIKDSTDPEEFAAYLKKYPRGEFAELARIRLRANAAKSGAASKVDGERKQEETATVAQAVTAAESQPAQANIAPAVEPRPEPKPTPHPREEALKLLRQDFPNKFSYKTTAPGADPNVASVTTDVVIDYEPLQFDGCRIEWRDVKDILSVSLSDIDPRGIKVEERSRPNTTFSMAVWNLGIATLSGKKAIQEFKAGSEAVNLYNGLDLQFNNKEKAERLGRLLRRSVELCAGAEVRQ